MRKRICKYLLLSAINLVLAINLSHAQPQKPQSIAEKDSTSWLDGAQLYFNLAGMVLWQASDYGELEAGMRINIRNKYFPTVEGGVGLCDKSDDETALHYKASAPFVRLGADYNFARQKKSHNRIFGGFRIGYTNFKYDLDGPPIADPYWGGAQSDFKYTGIKSNALWGELVFGLQTKIWRFLHMGWTARYKTRLHQKVSSIGQAWYIPGYGKNDDHLFTGTFNVVIDI